MLSSKTTRKGDEDTSLRFLPGWFCCGVVEEPEEVSWHSCGLVKVGSG